MYTHHSHMNYGLIHFIINLISKIYYYVAFKKKKNLLLCKKGQYAFVIVPDYFIITWFKEGKKKKNFTTMSIF